jgi:hypothetical protein
MRLRVSGLLALRPFEMPFQQIAKPGEVLVTAACILHLLQWEVIRLVHDRSLHNAWQP